MTTDKRRVFFRWSLVTDPLTKRATIILPARLPGHVVRKRKRTRDYLVCRFCGAEKAVTIFRYGKHKSARIMLCANALHWATEKHSHGKAVAA